MPPGLETTVPAPAPFLITLSGYVLGGGATVNAAATVCAVLMVTVHVPVPVQPPPLQPVKVEPVDGTAVKVTEVPELNEALQVLPQVTPVGLEMTLPEPVPVLVTLRRYAVGALWANVAVTLRAAVMLTVQVVAVPAQPPLQPVKVEPVDGTAVKVTEAL
jgi:hypothetical protein